MLTILLRNNMWHTTYLRASSLQNTHIEGLEEVMSRFANILEEVRRKPYDLLDASQTIFERDYLEFNVYISDLESLLQVTIYPILL